MSVTVEYMNITYYKLFSRYKSTTNRVKNIFTCWHDFINKTSDSGTVNIPIDDYYMVKGKINSTLCLMSSETYWTKSPNV